MSTANKLKPEAENHPPLFFGRSVFCFLLFFTISISVEAQKLKNYYVSFHQEKGTLFFIRPQEGFKNKDLGSRLVYDITCSSDDDSLTFNFSYFDKISRSPDSLSLILGNRNCVSSLQRLFVDSKGREWQYRYSSRFARKDMEAFFIQETSAGIQLREKGQTLLLICNGKKWKKNAEINRKIFQLIRHNS